MTSRDNRGAVEKEVLSAQVKDRILTWILEGDLEPGSRIVETQIARELGTSQTPVREALRDLATLGLVETQAYKGSWVRNPTLDELQEAIVVRAELEALAGRLAAVRRSEACIADLERLLGEMMNAAERGDPHGQAIKNAEFHERIVEAAGNRTLARVWSLLEPYSRTYITASRPGIDLHWLGKRHDAILEAIKARDPDLAEEAMRSHAAEAANLLEDFELADSSVGDGILDRTERAVARD